jgi:hypothetical protein
MLGADPMVSTEKPRFQVREDTVNMNVLPFDFGDMLISRLGEPTVGHPSVSVDRASRYDIGPHELNEGLARDIPDNAESYPSSVFASDLHGTRHDDLATGSTTAGTGLWTADVGLVGLYNAMKKFPALLDRGGAEFMEHMKCGLVTTNAHLASKLNGRHAGGNGSHKPSGLKPYPEGDFRAVHDGPCRHGCLKPTLLALEEFTGGFPIVEIRPATGTQEPVRPTGLDQVLQASLFVREEALEGETGFRIEGARHAVPPGFSGILQSKAFAISSID